ncbi:MAG: ATP-dependent Clp protease proteolytic subunit [Candidatus Desulfofervidaceae bacterium]|nr:ATP-dependent Clp protease proteolytic subunit [Candidatus Desulfofervidaceae bacterium]
MPNWNQVLKEIQNCPRIDKLDYIRLRYLKKLFRKTGRNIICYYSGFLQKNIRNVVEINDDDKNGFMTTIHKLDRSKGLDLFLHTPGGQIAATESIVNYLRKMFGNDIRAIIPQIAMSAGTMIACSCKEIIMGKQSNIGPIDPQFSGIPAQGVLDEFKRAIEEVKKDPASIPIWQQIISKYHPTFIGECQHAVELAEELVKEWLITGMFSEDSDKKAKATTVIEKLGSHKETKTHSRHIHIEQALEMGLKVLSIEEDFDDEFQDLVLTIHHCYMHTFAQSTSVKIIENHRGERMVLHVKEIIQHIPTNIQQTSPADG